MGKIKLNNIRLHAWHGCLKEESIIGSDYRVDLEIQTNLSSPSESDRLGDTVDYVHLNNIVKEEMAQKSKLLEHVAKRILDRIFSEIPKVDEAEIAVSKINPPIGGDVESVTVILSAKNNQWYFGKDRGEYYLCPLNGIVAEWLGTALQKLVQRFESARCLYKKGSNRTLFLLTYLIFHSFNTLFHIKRNKAFNHHCKTAKHKNYP